MSFSDMASLYLESPINPAPSIIGDWSLLIFLSFIKNAKKWIKPTKYRLHIVLLQKDSVKLKIPGSLARRRCGKINAKLKRVSVTDYKEEKDAFIWELSSISPLREGLALSLPLFLWEEVVVTWYIFIPHIFLSRR